VMLIDYGKTKEGIEKQVISSKVVPLTYSSTIDNY